MFHSDENRRTFSFRNRDGRFYVLDTVIAPVPVLPDGSYYVYSEKYGGRTRYEKHTLSLAVRQQGGDLGYFPRGVMVKSFEEAAFSAEKNKVTDPIQTQFGWHLIKVVDKK